METPETKPEQPGEFENALREAAASGPSDDLRVGDRLKGRIVLVGDKESFLDFGGRSEAVIATRELKDDKGNLRHGVGDLLVATVESVDTQVVVTLGRRSGPLGKEILKERFESRVPVEGVVKATNKGGFEVSVGGRRAFCPYSQIDLVYCDKPESYIGQKLSFLIVRIDGGARNVVLSRRAILEEERKKKAEETEARLREGEEFEGIVSRVLPFGAFIDIGGVEGLLHVSEFSHGHVSEAASVLSSGQQVRVKVVGIESGKKGRRISLSMKALEPDPWIAAAEGLKPGAVVKGKVARLADFGAFIEIAPGIDGLLHVSEIALGRIKHPKEVLTAGEMIDVKILEVDVEKKRIALSHKALEADSRRTDERPRYAESRPRKKEPESRRPADQPGAPTESLDTLLARLKEKYEDDTLG
ncbi:MAG: S1 RNA-binding domain-containing protein [Candidatus Latescibacterota bacterium]|nr:MAG: S1 RNA-binding domain-containing protein [Candidatus Latescibacterota bacterium]